MALEVKIQRAFGDFKLNVQFQSDSRRIGILGASGCGKSLTLKSIAGIERPETGKIETGGKVFLIPIEDLSAAAGKESRLPIPKLCTFSDDDCGKEHRDRTSLWKKGKGSKGSGNDRTVFSAGTGKKASGTAIGRAAAESGACEDHDLRAGDDSVG